MPQPPAAPRARAFLRACFLPAACALLAFAYAAAHLNWYRTTPLGQFPVLDEQENLTLAEALVRGELPKEPFYRAMGYPLLLACFLAFGTDPAHLFSVALTLGAVLHALTAALLAQIARTWFGRRAALAAGLLAALNPVLVHYATQALDATPALTIFLAGLAILAPAVPRAPHPTSARLLRWLLAALAWAAAAMFRPNYLPACALLPVAAFWIHRPFRRAFAPALASFASLLVFLAVGLWQSRVSGVFGFLPWQGAYNLWAANQPGTHGRYFVQRVAIPSSVASLNPTRAESIYLFRQETGAPPTDAAALNAHWRHRFFAHVAAHPLDWLGLLARKTYALVNSWEQYNNKTFAFHQQRSPWLRWNPLTWGLLLVLAVAGAFRLARENPPLLRTLGLLALTLAAGIVLFFVSARFRLPLVALVTLLAAAALAAPRAFLQFPSRLRLALVAALALTAALTFSNVWDTRSRATFVEDHALLARAASAVGDDAQAWTHAHAALALYPDHRDALRVATASFFNHLVRYGAAPAPESDWLAVCRRLLAAREPDTRDLQALAALALWRAGDRTDAFDEWHRLGRTPSAIAARLLIGDRSANPSDLLASRPQWDEPLVRLAAAHLRLPGPDGRPTGDPRRAAEVVHHLFGSPSLR